MPPHDVSFLFGSKELDNLLNMSQERPAEGTRSRMKPKSTLLESAKKEKRKMASEEPLSFFTRLS